MITNSTFDSINKVNMTKISDTTRIEKIGVAKLTSFLQSKYLDTHFNTDDRIPIYDGNFVLLNRDSTPIKTFNVQIKSSENLTYFKNGANCGKTYYDIEPKLLENVRNKISEDPTIFFLVDIRNNRIFYLYISNEFLNSVKKGSYKRCYFGPNEQLKDLDSFVKILKDIANDYLINVIKKTPPEIANIRIALNDFNKTMDNLSVIKKSLFPNVWNFGISCSNYPSLDISATTREGSPIFHASRQAFAYGLYPRFIWDNNLDISEFNIKTHSLFELFSFSNELNPKMYLTGCVEKIVDYFFDSPHFIMLLPKEVINEIAYSLLDAIALRNKKYCSKEKHGKFLNEFISYKDFKKIVLEDSNYNYIDNHLLSVFLIAVDKLGLSKFTRIWDYASSSLTPINCVSDFFDEKLYKNAFDIFVKNISNFFDTTIKIIGIDCMKLCGTLSYNVRKIYRFGFETYSIDVLHKDLNGEFNPIKKENIKFDFQHSFSSGVEMYVSSRMPYYLCLKELCTIATYKYIGIKPKTKRYFISDHLCKI